MKLLREGHSFSGREANRALLNCGRQGGFANASSVTGLDYTDDGRAIGVVDWDQDGDLDMWLHNRTGPRLRLMLNRNQHADRSDAAVHFLQVRLQGTKSNRDAIGARVEVLLTNGGSEKLVQTLYAGDAYLSQSSKWLHFGLGRETEIDRLVVRWPAGPVESFSGLAANSRYLLVEGTGQAEKIGNRPKLSLNASEQESPPAPPASRTMLVNRLPLPILRYSSETQTRNLTINGRPTLLCFWASWCETCLHELHELSDETDQLRSVGLDVLALSVDNVAAQDSHPRSKQHPVDNTQFPFGGGDATREMLEKLELINRVVFNQQIPFQVPTSLLIDSHGNLAVVYRGRVRIATLVEDVRNLNLPVSERRKIASPLGGRWSSPARNLLLRPVARLFKERGYLNDYAHYIDREVDIVEARRAKARTKTERQQLDDEIARTHFSLARTLQLEGRLEAAIEHYQDGLALNSGDVQACNYLGMAYHASREFEQAAYHFRDAIKLDPNHAQAYNGLGKSLRAQNKVNDAIQQYRRAIELEPEFIDAHFNLAVALVVSKELTPAVHHFRVVLRRQPDHVEALINLGGVLARRGHFSPAIKNLQRAVRLSPEHYGAVMNLAGALLQSGQYEEAIEQYLVASTLRNGDHQPHLRLGEAFRKSGRDDLAAKHLETAIKLKPRDARPVLRLAWLRATSPDAEARNGKQAVQLAARLNKATGNRDPRVLDTLAAAYAEAGQFEEAVKAAERALQVIDAKAGELAAAINTRLNRYREGATYRTSQ